MKTAFLLTRARAFYRATVDILRPQRTTDQVVIGSAQQGSPCSTLAHLSVDTGTENQEAIATRGRLSVQSHVILNETTVHLTCQVLTTSGGTPNRVGFYQHGNKLVFAYTLGCNGNVAFLTAILDGATATWQQTQTPPN